MTRRLAAGATPIQWSEIASAGERSPLYDEMVALADDLAALGPDLGFTLNHEPETRIGADLYNWYTCQGTNRPWVSFEALAEPVARFAVERSKPLALPEFASAADPSDGQRRVWWMDAAVDVLLRWDEGPDRAVDLDYVAWFDVTAPGGTYPDCRWSHRSDEPTRRAFSRMVRDLVGR